VLAAIQHHQRLGCHQGLNETVQRLARARGRVRWALVAEPEGGRRRPGHRNGVHHRTQLDQPGPTGKMGCQVGRHDGRQPGLARAARTDQGDQTGLDELPRDPGPLLVPIDEAGQRLSQVALRPAAARPRPDVLTAEQRQVGALDLGSRVGSELVRDQPPIVVVGGQRFGSPSVRSERREQEEAEPLPQGVRGRQFPQLGHEVGGFPRGLEVGLDAVLGRGEAELVESDGGARGEGSGGDAGQRLAPPEPEGLSQQMCRKRGLTAAQRATPLTQEALEPDGVHRIRRHVEPVAAWSRPQDLASRQRTAQA